MEGLENCYSIQSFLNVVATQKFIFHACMLAVFFVLPSFSPTLFRKLSSIDQPIHFHIYMHLHSTIPISSISEHISFRSIQRVHLHHYGQFQSKPNPGSPLLLLLLDLEAPDMCSRGSPGAVLLYLRRLSIRCREQQHPLDPGKVELPALWNRLPLGSHRTVLQWPHRSRCSKYDILHSHMARKHLSR